MTEKDELVEVVAEMLRRQGLDEVRAVGTATRAIASIRPTIVRDAWQFFLDECENGEFHWDRESILDRAKSHGLDLTQDGER